MKRNWIIKGATVVFASLIFYACKKEIEGSSNSPFSEIWSLVSNDQILLDMTYETEITTYSKILNDRAAEHSNFFDLVEAQPSVKRQSVILKLKTDGSIFMETNDLSPLRPAPTMVHLSSPSDLKPVVKTVLNATEIKMYNIDDELVGTSALEQPIKCPDLVQTIQDMKTRFSTETLSNTLTTMQLSAIYSSNLANIEQQAINNGGQIIMNGNLKLIKMPYSDLLNPSNRFLVVTLDNVKKIPLYMDITNAHGKASTTITYQYNNINNESPVLKSINTASYTTSAAGSDIVRHNNISFDNVRSIIH